MLSHDERSCVIITRNKFIKEEKSLKREFLRAILSLSLSLSLLGTLFLVNTSSPLPRSLIYHVDFNQRIIRHHDGNRSNVSAPPYNKGHSLTGVKLLTPLLAIERN